MTMPEYIDLLAECVERLPPDMVIHRLTGDGPKSLLIAPLWSMNKREVLNTIRREFTQRDVYTVHGDMQKVRDYVDIIRRETENG